MAFWEIVVLVVAIFGVLFVIWIDSKPLESGDYTPLKKDVWGDKTQVPDDSVLNERMNQLEAHRISEEVSLRLSTKSRYNGYNDEVERVKRNQESNNRERAEVRRKSNYSHSDNSGSYINYHNDYSSGSSHSCDSSSSSSSSSSCGGGD